MAKLQDYELRKLGQQMIDFKDDIRDLTNNGKFQFSVVNSVPSWRTNDGEMAFYTATALTDRRIYVRLDSGWSLFSQVLATGPVTGSPGGPEGAIQFNSSNFFQGQSFLGWNSANQSLTVGSIQGSLVTDTLLGGFAQQAATFTLIDTRSTFNGAADLVASYLCRPKTNFFGSATHMVSIYGQIGVDDQFNQNQFVPRGLLTGIYGGAYNSSTGPGIDSIHGVRGSAQDNDGSSTVNIVGIEARSYYNGTAAWVTSLHVVNPIVASGYTDTSIVALRVGPTTFGLVPGSSVGSYFASGKPFVITDAIYPRRRTITTGTGGVVNPSTDFYIGYGLATSSLANLPDAGVFTSTGGNLGAHRLILFIKDERGTAFTNPIQVKALSTAALQQTIDGSSSVSINANYGYVSLISTGSAWAVIGGDGFSYSNIATTTTKVPGVLFTTTALGVSSNSTTENELIKGVVGTTSLIANTLSDGKTIRLKAWGYYNTQLVPDTLRLSVLLGTTTIMTTGAQTPAGSVSTGGWSLSADITCQTTGGAGTVFGQGDFPHFTISTTIVNWQMVNSSAITVNTTGTNLIRILAQWGGANAANQIYMTNCVGELLN